MPWLKRFLALTLVATFIPIASAADLAAALAAFKARDYVTARSNFEVVAQKEQTSADVLFYLAASQFRSGDHEAAGETLDQLFEDHPEHLDGLYLLGMVNMVRLEEVSIFKKVGVAKAALASWQQMVDIDPGHALGNYAVFSYYANAPGIAGGDRDKARSMLPTLAELSPLYSELGQGILHSKEDAVDAAEQHFVRATEVADGVASPWFALAQFYFQQERYTDALTALERFEKSEQTWLDPDEAMTLFYRGTVLAKQGQDAQAKSSFEAALGANPNKRIREEINKALRKL